MLGQGNIPPQGSMLHFPPVILAFWVWIFKNFLLFSYWLLGEKERTKRKLEAQKRARNHAWKPQLSKARNHAWELIWNPRTVTGSGAEPSHGSPEPKIREWSCSRGSQNSWLLTLLLLYIYITNIIFSSLCSDQTSRAYIFECSTLNGRKFP